MSRLQFAQILNGHIGDFAVARRRAPEGGVYIAVSAAEAVAEGVILLLRRQPRIPVYAQQRFPLHGVDAAAQRLLHIAHHKGSRQSAGVIGRRCPLACVGVNPRRRSGRVASHKHSKQRVGSHRIDLVELLAVNHQLVGDGRQQQLFGRVVVVCHQRRNAAARLAVERLRPRNTVVGRP